MIAASRRMAAAALAIAAALHLTGIMRLNLTDDIQIAGGQVGATQASLGDAFADLSEGTLTAVETEDVTQPVEVEEAAEGVPPEEAVAETDPTDETPRPQPNARVSQTQVDAATNQPQPQAMVTAEAPDDTVEQPDPQATIVAVPDAEPLPFPTLRTTAPTVTATDTVQTVTATPQPETLSAVTPVAPIPPVEATPPDPEAQPEMLTADEPDQLEVTQSLRPKVRSRAFEERNKPDDPPPAPRRVTRADPAPAVPAPQGNQAQSNTRAGQTDGAANATAAQRATGSQQSASAGNAAVSNYPGQVVRRIQRVRRPRIKDVGAPAVVTFRIAANGGLSAVSIQRSSGSAALDRAAIQMILRAAPFPPPPPGAQRSFNMPIKGG